VSKPPPDRSTSDAASGQCPNCERLQRRVQHLEERLAALEEQLRRGRRQAAPFGRDRPSPDPKPPGRKPGEGTFRYRTPPQPEEVARTLAAALSVCPHCSGEVHSVRDHEQFEVDLPRCQPVTTRFLTQSGYCPRCKQRVRARHPEQSAVGAGAAGVALGPRVRGLAADLKHRLGIPYAKVAELLRVGFGFPVTASALCQSDARLAYAAEPDYRALGTTLRHSPACHVDETGWRVGNDTAWLWTLTNAAATLYAIAPSRGHEVFVRVLGKDYEGVLHADCFLAYEHHQVTSWRQQKCLAHLLKDLSQLKETPSRFTQEYADRLSLILREALALHRTGSAPTTEPSPPVAPERVDQLGERLDRLIEEGLVHPDPAAARFARRLRRHRGRLLVFLTDGDAEPTNNRAERALRPAVIVRKTGGCNKGWFLGARVHAVLASILVTARQRGVDSLAYWQHVLTSAERLPRLLPPNSLDSDLPGPASL
jgi:transposase